jgi:ribosomal protein S9
VAATKKQAPAAKPAAKGKGAAKGRAKGAGKMRPEEAAKMPSHGIAHALYEGDFKLMLDINNDAPAALYDLKNDLAEQKNLIADPAHAERVKRMEATYRAIRASKRSVEIITAPAQP